MNGDIFDLLGPSAPMPEQLKLSRRASKRLRTLGIRNICVTNHDENYGPYLHIYLTKKSQLYRQLSKNPAFLTDILILAKDTKEVVLKDERSLLIIRPLDKKGLKLLMIETTREFRDNASNLIDRVVSSIGENALDPEYLSRTLEEMLTG